MNETESSLRANLRIIWAIAAKDIADAIKNKTTVSVILGVAVLMLSGQALPLITRLSSVHWVVVYDAGESRLVGQLKRSPQLRLIKASSQQEMEDLLGERGGAALGLVLPVGFDQALDAGQPPELYGYFMHWVGSADAAEAQAFFEEQLTLLAGRPVYIAVAGDDVYPHPDSDGQPFMAAMYLAIVIVIISGVLVPYLMLEEREAKTMDVLLVSPARVSQVIIGKAIAGMVYGLVAAGVVFAFYRGLVVHWEWAILAALCGTTFAVAVGLLLGSLFDNPQNLGIWMGLVFIALLVPVFLSLMTSNLPEFLSAVMAWIPSAALTKVFRISFSGSVPLDQVMTNLGIVMGSAVLLLAAVVWIVRRSDR
jgi:ABC-type Na+ efflux pump permease subunit